MSGEAHAIITRVMVSGLPLDNVNAFAWSLHVEWRGGDQYVVTNGFQPATVYAADGSSRYEGRDWSDEERAPYRFTYNEAMALAVRLVPGLVINGMTAADVLARSAEAES